jgi:hypothetical protein
MRVPAYVRELIERAVYNYNSKSPDYSVGYTIDIEKRSDYGWVSYLADEIERLKKWVERQPGGEMVVIDVPKETRLRRQTATVTIFDPVMQHIEKFIPPRQKGMNTMPIPKEQIQLLCKDENFIQDFLRYESVREQRKRFFEAIKTIKELTPPERLETAVDLTPAEVNLEHISKSEKLHSNLLEDVYGITWHCYETIIGILSKEGRV